MRIVYPLLWSKPGRQACREQTVKTAAALARRGHEVTLMMPQREREPSLGAADLRDYFSVAGDFRLVQRPSRWAGERLLSSLMWLRQLFADAELGKADLLYSRIPAMLGAGHLSPVPYATDHYRRWPDDVPAVRPFLQRTARHPNCLGIVLHSHYAAECYRRAGIGEDRILVAHNGTDAAVGPIDRATARTQLRLPHDRAIAVYAGRIGPDKGLDQLVGLADLRPEILFLLVGSEGDGPIEREAAGRANLCVLPWAGPAELPLWLAAADVLLIPPSRAPLERYRNCVLPMKVFAYLAAGTAILAPSSPDTAELLEHEENAFLVEPERPDLAAAALDRLLADRTLAARLGASARRLSERLTWESRADKIAEFLQSRLAQRSLYTSTVAPASPAMTGAAQAPTAAGKLPT